MERVTIGFYEETYTKLVERAKHKKLELSPYVRQLVELGLRIEEMSEQKDIQSDDTSSVEAALKFQQKLLQKDLTSGYETLYLVRYILTILKESSVDDQNKIFDTAKLRAQSFVEGLIGEKA